MANYWTDISFNFTIPADRLAEVKSIQAKIDAIIDASHEGEQSEEDENIASAIGGYSGVLISYAPPREDLVTLWIRSDESANLEYVAYFLERLKEAKILDKPVSFEWSGGCSKQRVGAFGGGACVVFPDRETMWQGTTQWINKVIAKWSSENDVGAALELVHGLALENALGREPGDKETADEAIKQHRALEIVGDFITNSFGED